MNKFSLDISYSHIMNCNYSKNINKHFFWGSVTNDYNDFDIFIQEISLKNFNLHNFSLPFSQNIDTTNRELIYQFKNTNDNNFTALVYLFDNDFNNYRFSYVELNDSLKILKKNKIPNFINSGNNIDYIKINKNYYFAGMVNFYSNPLQTMECLAIYKFDSNFNELNNFKYGYQQGKNVKSTGNKCIDTIGNFIYSGGTRNYLLGLFPQDFSWYSVAKIDTNFNVQWEKYFGGDAYYHLWSVKATKDGGCLLMGTRYDYTTQKNERDPFVLKIDSDGNLLTIKDLPKGFEIRNIIVYPNPGKDKLYYNYDIKETMQFEMYNSQGSKVISQTLYSSQGVIETNEIPNGFYLYRFSAKNGCIQSGKWIKE